MCGTNEVNGLVLETYTFGLDERKGSKWDKNSKGKGWEWRGGIYAWDEVESVPEMKIAIVRTATAAQAAPERLCFICSTFNNHSKDLKLFTSIWLLKVLTSQASMEFCHLRLDHPGICPAKVVALDSLRDSYP